MPRYLVAVEYQGEGKIEEVRIDADSPLQAAYQAGIKVGMESRDGLADTIRLCEIVAVNKIVETLDVEWSL